MNCLKPSVSLLVKLGSLIVHFDETRSSKSHMFDTNAIETLLNDAEVKAWLDSMNKAAYLPVKR